MKKTLIIASLFTSTLAFGETIAGYEEHASGYQAAIACEVAQARAYNNALKECADQSQSLAKISYSACRSVSWMQQNNYGPSNPLAEFLGYTGQSITMRQAWQVVADFSCAANVE